MKIPMTSAGIEPATFQLVTQHLNHCATAVPLSSNVECVISGLGRDVNEVLVLLGCNTSYNGS